MAWSYEPSFTSPRDLATLHHRKQTNSLKGWAIYSKAIILRVCPCQWKLTVMDGSLAGIHPEAKDPPEHSSKTILIWSVDF